jgi:hypothetical protein
MRNYLIASAAYGAGLTQQVSLGARLVAVMDQLLNEQSSAARNETIVNARHLQDELRLNKTELTRLKKILSRAARAAKLSFKELNHAFVGTKY